MPVCVPCRLVTVSSVPMGWARASQACWMASAGCVVPVRQAVQDGVGGIGGGNRDAVGVQGGGEAAGNFRGVAQVDADADDQPVQVLAGGGGVDQDARELGAADEHIVRPFQHGGRGKELLDRFGDRDAGQEREKPGLGGGACGAKQDREVEIALRRLPAAAPAAAPGGLLQRQDGQALRLTRFGAGGAEIRG